MRFTAIVLMVIFHMAFDLDQFKFLDIDFNNDQFWYWLPRFIVLLFMLCVGFGLKISHTNSLHWSKIQKRFFKIFIPAIIISIYTYYAFPKNWIYFGTLHCIAFASVLALPFLNRPKTSLIIGVIFNLSYWILDIKHVPLISKSLNIVPMDYVPLYPWFGVVLIGIYLWHIGGHKILLAHSPHPFIVYCSKYSLYIYLIHQPVIYGLVLLASKLS